MAELAAMPHQKRNENSDKPSYVCPLALQLFFPSMPCFIRNKRLQLRWALTAKKQIIYHSLTLQCGCLLGFVGIRQDLEITNNEKKTQLFFLKPQDL